MVSFQNWNQTTQGGNLPLFMRDAPIQKALEMLNNYELALLIGIALLILAIITGWYFLSKRKNEETKL